MAVALFTSVSFGTVHLSSDNASAAVLLAKESFDYAPGALGGQNGDVGWAGPWVTGSAAGLASPQFQVVSPGLEYAPASLLNAQGNSIARNPGTVPGNSAAIRQHNHVSALIGESLWFSFLVNLDAVTQDFRFFPVAASSVGSGSAQAERGLGVLITDDFGQGALARIGLGTSVGPGLSLNLGSETLIAGRIDLPSTIDGSVTVTLWADPTVSDLQFGTGSISLTNGNLQNALGGPTQVGSFADLDRLFFRYGSTFEGSIDEIRLGTSGPVVIMPEPGRAMLLGLAGLFLLARRRR